MFDKYFVCERGFGKVIAPFSEVITKGGWEFFCEHKAPGFSALPREFYANMVGMKDDSIFVRGVWVPFDDRSINEVIKLRDYKHGSKYKKLLEGPNYKKNSESLDWRRRKVGSDEEESLSCHQKGSSHRRGKGVVLFYMLCNST